MTKLEFITAIKNSGIYNEEVDKLVDITGYNNIQMVKVFPDGTEVVAAQLIDGVYYQYDIQPFIDKYGNYNTDGCNQYQVTLYFHSNATINVFAHDEQEAIDIARGMDLTGQIMDGLIEDNSPDVEII